MRILLPTKVAALLFACCLLFNNNAKAQFVTLPDAKFATWLSTHGYASCVSGNQLDTTCQAMLNTVYLEIADTAIHRIKGIYYFKNLDTLKLTVLNLYMAIDSLEDLPNGLQILMAQGGGAIKKIRYFPNSLLYVHVGGNTLTQLPSLPPALKYLSCFSNPLTSLPALPSTLSVLSCGLSNIQSLPALAGTVLTHLDVTNMGLLTSLPPLPTTLVSLAAMFSGLTSLPALPASLTTLDCQYNHLTALPALPAALAYLSCSNNPITVLPALPANLNFLQCAGCSLTALPAIPPSLTQLICSNNQLTALPPNMVLSNLYCSGNAISAIQGLKIAGYPRQLDCSNNQLTNLDVIYDSLDVFNCNNNPGLSCMPHINKVSTLNFANTAITCLPNYGIVGSSTPALDSIPLCGLINAGGCPPEWNISGKVYLDGNSNCIYNTSDSLLKNIRVQLWKNTVLEQETFTGGQGLYSFKTTNGNYAISIDTANSPFIVSCPAGTNYTGSITTADPFDSIKDFAMICRPQFDLTAWSIIAPGIFRPANNTVVHLSAGDLSHFYNAHCANGVSGTVSVTFSGPATFVSAAAGALTPSSVSGNVITWNVANFGSANFNADYNIIVRTDTFAQSGQQICFTLSITPTANDYNPANNTLTQCFLIVNSHDPNDKQVYPAGNILPSTEWLTYTIRFQNTGNAEAQNIYINDTLDGTNLDISTFQLLAYSHQPMVQILEGGIARFNFPNINLPDSFTNEPASHGYVQYKIKLFPNKALGTQIKNTAYIYFDFNPPVVTNTTLNTISLVSSASVIGPPSSVLFIFPNPANNYVQITTDANALGGTLSVTDITGRELTTLRLQTENFKLETVNYPSGMYFVTVKAGMQMVTKKLVIER